MKLCVMLREPPLLVFLPVRRAGDGHDDLPGNIVLGSYDRGADMLLATPRWSMARPTLIMKQGEME